VFFALTFAFDAISSAFEMTAFWQDITTKLTAIESNKN
jgi:hypothetical protein